MTLLQQAGIIAGQKVLDVGFRFELYRLKALLRGRRTHDVHPGFTREQLLKLLSEQRLEEVKYEQLSSTWRLGSNDVSIFLLQARPGA